MASPITPITVNVGKQAITEQVILELRRHLAKKKQVRIKVLRTAFVSADREKMVETIKQNLNHSSVRVVGNVITVNR